MRVSDAFPSTHIKASDLQDRDATVTIAKVTIEEIGKDRENKPVLYFQGKEKGLVLNKTNAQTIAGLYGQETDDWVGKAITIFPTQTDFAGEQVECIRVRLRTVAVAAAVAVVARPTGGGGARGDDMSDEIPFILPAWATDRI